MRAREELRSGGGRRYARGAILIHLVSLGRLLGAVRGADAEAAVDDDAEHGRGGRHGYLGVGSGGVDVPFSPPDPHVGVFCTFTTVPLVFFILGLTSIRTASPG